MLRSEQEGFTLTNELHFTSNLFGGKVASRNVCCLRITDSRPLPSSIIHLLAKIQHYPYDSTTNTLADVAVATSASCSTDAVSTCQIHPHQDCTS